LDSKQNLQVLSALAVQVLFTRRRKQERDCNKNSQQLACIAHDLLAQLSGIELSLSLLREDKDFHEKLIDKHKDGLSSRFTFERKIHHGWIDRKGAISGTIASCENEQ
jgi:hypothetical protein